VPASFLPALMGLTIIVTGNRYFIDAVPGGIVSVLALIPWVLPHHRGQEPYGLQSV